jgi:hypothetical protein
MRGREGWTRREVLLLAAVFGAPLVPWRRILESWADRAAARDSHTQLLASLIRQQASARVIGEAYLAATPTEADAGTLVEAIYAGLERGASDVARGAPNPEKLRRALLDRVRRDFEEGATVSLEGWIVSRTEARLCGLAKLKLS